MSSEPAAPPLLTATLLVAAGGALGAWLRSLAPGTDDLGSMPWATLAVNAAGSLALGLLVGHLRSRGGPRWAKPLLGTGLLGGFTTFSAFAVHTAERASGAPGIAAAYVLLTVLSAVAAASLGLLAASRPARSGTAR